MIPRDALLATLKGPPLAVWLCLLFYGPGAALRPAFIARKTRYSRPAVYDALYFLADHELAQELPSVGWVATSHTTQLALDLVGPLLPDHRRPPAAIAHEIGNDNAQAVGVNLVYSPPCSSSGYFQDPGSPDWEPTTTTTAPERVNEVYTLVEDDPQWADLVDLLTSKAGTPRARAIKAARAARDLDALPGWSEKLALAWLIYAGSPEGKSINNVGLLVAARVADNTPPPVTWSPDRRHPLFPDYQNAHLRYLAEDTIRTLIAEEQAGDEMLF